MINFSLNLSTTYTNNQFVHKSINVGALELGLAAVHHELGVASSEDDHSVTPLGVAQNTATQQDFLVVQGVGLPLPLHLAFKLGQAIVGGLTDDLGCVTPNR